MSFKELTNKMKKGEAPNIISYKGIVFKYQGRYAAKEERLKDIDNYGLWNNGGYCSDYGDFLLDYITENNFKKADITELPDIELEDKDIPLIPDDELIILKQEKAIDMQKAIDFNFKVLQEKINQVVEELNKRQ